MSRGVGWGGGRERHGSVALPHSCPSWSDSVGHWAVRFSPPWAAGESVSEWSGQRRGLGPQGCRLEMNRSLTKAILGPWVSSQETVVEVVHWPSPEARGMRGAGSMCGDSRSGPNTLCPASFRSTHPVTWVCVVFVFNSHMRKRCPSCLALSGMGAL